MEIYLFILAIITLLYAFLFCFSGVSYKSIRFGDVNTDLRTRPVKSVIFYFASVSLSMIAVIGLRNIGMGIDTKAYYIGYYSERIFMENILSSNLDEPGYAFIKSIFQNAGLNFQVFLFVTAALYVCLVTYIIFCYSNKPWLSYFLFIGFGYFTFAMSGIRQTIAMAFVLAAFLMIKNKKIIPFILLVVFAASIHRTAIIFLPAYFLDKIDLKKKTLLIFTSFAVVVLALQSPIRTLLNDYARLGYETVTTGGDMMYLFLLGTVLVGIIFGHSISVESGFEKIFFYMMLVSTIIFPVTMFNPTVMRLHYYFSIFMIIYIPNMLGSIKDRLLSTFGHVMYIAVCIYMMITQVFLVTSKLYPYKFFWD